MRRQRHPTPGCLQCSDEPRSHKGVRSTANTMKHEPDCCMGVSVCV
jgi:hypothetical protein